MDEMLLTQTLWRRPRASKPFKLLLIIVQEEGVGADTHHAKSFSVEEEDTLWTSQVLNIDTPNRMLRAAFVVSGKCFCVRGGIEHQQLSVSQLKQLSNPDRHIYTEHSSKNRPEGIHQLKLDHN